MVGYLDDNFDPDEYEDASKNNSRPKPPPL
jgi:hypothetical protein